jgi:hypothetical protein
MARELVPDALWERLAPLIPVPKKIRDERRDDIHFSLLVLGCWLILFRRLQP